MKTTTESTRHGPRRTDAPTLALRQAELLGQLPPGYVAALFGADTETGRRVLQEAEFAAIGEN